MMNKDRATAERLIGTGLDDYVSPLADLVTSNQRLSLTEEIIELALLIGYETGVARATETASFSDHLRRGHWPTRDFP